MRRGRPNINGKEFSKCYLHVRGKYGDFFILATYLLKFVLKIDMSSKKNFHSFKNQCEMEHIDKVLFQHH